MTGMATLRHACMGQDNKDERKGVSGEKSDIVRQLF